MSEDYVRSKIQAAYGITLSNDPGTWIQSIFYQFSVVGKNDTYKLSIDIRHDGTCYLFINSLKRSPISYTGQIVEQG